MRIIRAVIVVIAFMSALTFWMEGREWSRGELQRLQGPPDAETVIPPDESRNENDQQTPEPPGIDTTVPNVLSVELSSQKVDTLKADQRITVTAHITDDLSGFRYLELHFAPASGGTQFFSVRIDTGNTVSGDKRDGIFWGNGDLPQHSVQGRWFVSSVFLIDEVMNGCGEGNINGNSVRWKPCKFAVELPYLINGEDSGQPVPPVETVPSEPVGADATPGNNETFIPSVSP